MNRSVLIADCGGTRADWALVTEDGISYFSTTGFTPSSGGLSTFSNVLRRTPIVRSTSSVGRVQYYGAGMVRNEDIRKMRDMLVDVFQTQQDNIEVESDMLAAARSVYEGKECLVAILGTGSNICRFDGIKLYARKPFTGFCSR